MKKQTGGLVVAGVAVVALVTAAAGYYVWTSRTGADPLAACRRGEVAGPSIGGPFTLVDPAGRTVTDADVLTGPTLVYFGYTFCPDVCPMDMSRNAEAADLLAKDGKALKLVFISVDPARDTPQVAGEFARAIHPDAVGLSGSPEQVAAAAKAYRVYYRANDDDPDYYTVDHSTYSYLMLPGIGFANFYGHTDTAESVAENAGCMIDAAARAN